MTIEILGRNVQVDDRLRRLAEKKLQKLSKFLEEPLDIRVTLSAGKHTHTAELHVSHRLGVLTATEETEGTFLEALDRALDRAEEQARRTHQKVVDKRRHGSKKERPADRSSRWPVEVLEQGSVGGGAVPRVIETREIHVKPMTIEEAALELDGAENGFVVFRDSLSDRLSVLYRRKDQHYGLIAPEL
ncbi:MAG TPA: ribosome-associated translation inhibitor RaiA [Thermoanaerobaculia bacterium]|nr:ribosome-associated translation inhibitor RaiA [Thermoanaerobaculia bacterium]